MCACRTGRCEVNNNYRSKKTTTKKVTKKAVCRDSSSDWTDSDSGSECAGCCQVDSSSSCTCSECNMETDSSDCCNQGPKKKKSTKVLRCRDGVCEWVPKKKLQKETKKTAAKKTKPRKNCYDCY